MNQTLIALLSVGLIGALFAWVGERHALSDVTARLTASQQQLASQQLEAEGLAAELLVSEHMLQSILFDKASYERLLTHYEAEIASLQQRSQQLTAHIASLRGSDDETTRTWANTELPADARRLLQHALQAPHPDGEQTATAVTAGKSAIGLPKQTF